MIRLLPWLVLSGLLWAQQKASVTSAEREKATWYAVQASLRDHKPGALVSPSVAQDISRLLLSKVGFYTVEGLEVAPDGQVRLTVAVSPDLPTSDLKEVLSAAGLEHLSFTRKEKPAAKP